MPYKREDWVLKDFEDFASCKLKIVFESVGIKGIR
jgi:hypothetical protein